MGILAQIINLVEKIGNYFMLPVQPETRNGTEYSAEVTKGSIDSAVEKTSLLTFIRDVDEPHHVM